MTQGAPSGSSRRVGQPEEPCHEGPRPTIQARWSKPKVTPAHNVNWPPNNRPLDTIPDEAKVKMLVKTTLVPDGTAAAITICNCVSGSSVRRGTIADLVVRGNKVVDPETGNEPEWHFVGTDLPWRPWDKPFYFFSVTVDYEGLEAETPKNFTAQENQCLRVIYWHAVVSDAIADTPAGGGLTTQAEMEEIAGFLGGLPNHKVYKRAFNQNNVPTGLWGSVIRNTYTYHHSSHGDLVDRTTGAQCNDGNNPPLVAPGNWQSVIVIGSTNIGDNKVRSRAKVISVPRYLAYFNTCLAGWEASFASAFLSRGTQHVIAFRMSIPDRPAREMASRFYGRWCNTYNCNPKHIWTVFWNVAPRYWDDMMPVLFGRGGGAANPGA